MAPAPTRSSPASGPSAISRGTAIERIPSCTVPMFSNVEVTFWATQPARAVICHAIGKAIATVPTAMRPSLQSHTATAPVPTISTAFNSVCVTAKPVISRNWRRKAAVCSSTASRTNASSSRARANSFTVRIFV